MKFSAVALLGLSLAACAQQTFKDPANLRGERVKAADGHALPVDQGARGLQQLLRKLNTRASLLLIVAHPDDEDGGMLTFYSRGLGARAAMLTLNRGEGGQNAMTGDFEDALGLLRTQELLSADRYSGVDQMFGTEVDFGFSKTKEEAFAKWTHQRVLYDAVRAVRLYRPLVIAAVFVGGVTDGHGQHQVSGQIAQEVYNAAGDPAVFPELTAEGILPWKPLKVYARVPRQAISDKGLFDYATGQYTTPRFVNYVTGEVTTTPPSADVVVHEGATDPLLLDEQGNPRSYVQFARIGLSLQRSQIPAGFRMPPVGVYDVGYHRYGSRLANQPAREKSFFDGIDTSVAGIASLLPDAPSALRERFSTLQSLIAGATSRFDPARPTGIAPALAEAMQQCNRLIEDIQAAGMQPGEREDALHELRVKRVQLNDALALALGIKLQAIVEPTLQTEEKPAFLDTEPTASDASLGSIVGILVRLDAGAARSREQPPVEVQQTSLRMEPAFVALAAGAGIAEDLSVTRPYFSRPDREQPFYDLSDPSLRNAPETPPHLIARDHVDYNGVSIEVASVVTAATRLPSGELFRQPLAITPPISLATSPRATVLPAGQATVGVTATLVNPASIPANINVQSPRGWVIDATLAKPGKTAADASTIDFTLHPPAELHGPQIIQLKAETPSHQAYKESFRAVGYAGVVSTNEFIPAISRIVPVNLKIPSSLRLAYLPGTGDAVPEALASLGLRPVMLNVADITPARLAGFDTVILGVRAYGAHPDLHGAPTQALLDYAIGGGNVLVQYQTDEFNAKDAPYPLTLGRDAEKVVDETDAVTLLDPASPLLSTPNQITAADFDGWIEERGHGFLRTWDSHYSALTRTHDPGQEPQSGGLITVGLGKGRWTYCAFALYRQLPEAVPGAYRLFVDLIAR